MSKTELIIDMSNPREKAAILDKIRQLQGMYRFEVSKYHKRRTDRQNRYYWPAFVQAFADHLRAQGDDITDEDAHEILKAKFLRKHVIDMNTGEVLEFPGSTAQLSTVEFNEYLDRCATWLSEFFGLDIPDPEVYRMKEEANA